MIRVLFTLLWVAIVALALFGMWWGWRARSRRDAGIVGANTALTGEVLAHFGASDATVGGLQYVSTTPVGSPLARVAIPGLRYRGPAEITVRRDGVTIEVAGEHATHLPAAQLRGTGSAGRRIGKAVEAGGLALLLWQPEAHRGSRERTEGRGVASSGTESLESSFRFASRDEQERFDEAIARIAHTDFEHQEGPR